MNVIERSHEFRKNNPELWNRLRSDIYARSDGQCECMGGYKNGGEKGSERCKNPIEQVHHIEYPVNPETITVEKLMGLCKTCHATRHEKISVLNTLPCCRYVHRVDYTQPISG